MKIVALFGIIIFLSSSCAKTEKEKGDKVPPQVICQNISVNLNESGNAIIIPSMINNGSSDDQTNIEDLTFSLDKETFNSANIGENEVTLTVADKSGNSSSCIAKVTISLPIPPAEIDSRTLSWIYPGNPWASYSGSYGVQIDGSRPMTTMPEPGYLAHIDKVEQPGEYTLSRGSDPKDPSKKAFYHRVSSTWDEWDQEASHTSRSEYYGGIEREDMFLEGEEYWYVTAFCFDTDCFGHRGYNIDISDIHEQTWNPETPGADISGGVMNAILLGDNGGHDTWFWRSKWITSYPPVVGTKGSGSLDIKLQEDPPVPNEWYYVIRKIKLHYDATQNPYIYVWVAKGNEPLVFMGSRMGPNAYNLDNPRYYPKVGLYKWDQTWGTKNTRTLWTKGLYVFKAAPPVGNEPVIDENSLLLLLRSL